MTGRTVFTLILLVSVCNALDGIMTLGWITLTEVTEFNPILRPLVERDPFGFIIAKTFVVTCLLGVLWVGRGYKVAKVGLVVLSVAYVGVLVYHAWGLCTFLVLHRVLQ